MGLLAPGHLLRACWARTRSRTFGEIRVGDFSWNNILRIHVIEGFEKKHRISVNTYRAVFMDRTDSSLEQDLWAFRY